MSKGRRHLRSAAHGLLYVPPYDLPTYRKSKPSFFLHWPSYLEFHARTYADISSHSQQLQVLTKRVMSRHATDRRTDGQILAIIL